MDLSGKNALVTGAAKRIGRSIALALAEKGANVVVHAHKSEDDGQNVVELVRGMGRKSTLVLHNLKDVTNTAEWFAEIFDQFGGIDILINSAAEYIEDSYESLKQDALDDAMALNVLSPLTMMREMSRRNEGVIVNILDTRVLDRDPKHASYHLAKRSLLTLTKDLAIDYAPGIRVNAVAPGIILPPPGHTADWLDRMAVTNPLKCYGSTDDVRDAVLYLVGARFLTGQIIYVDGGRHLLGSHYGT